MSEQYSVEQIIGEVVVKLCKEKPPLVDVEGIADSLLTVIKKNDPSSAKSVAAARALEFLAKAGVRL